MGSLRRCLNLESTNATSVARAESPGRAFGTGCILTLWGGQPLRFAASLRSLLFPDADFALSYCADNGWDSVPPSLLAAALLL